MLFHVIFNLFCLTLKGTVKLVFQPAEEGPAGAYHILKEGVLDEVQAMFGLHVDPTLATGSIGSRPGPFFSGSSRFSVVIKGKGGHAALPHASRDPILAASSIILALQQIISRETNPLEAGVSVLSIGLARSKPYLKEQSLSLFCLYSLGGISGVH